MPDNKKTSSNESQSTPQEESKDFPLKKGQEPKEVHLDIDNPAHGNKTYRELQDEANKK